MIGNRNRKIKDAHIVLSINDFLISSTIALGWASLNLKTLSITDSSVAVVSEPQNAV